PGATWAPSVLARPGGWVLYYAARDRSSNRQCISAATATSPAGPFTDASDAPLVCELDQGGSIDPSPYVAPGGQPHLVWKAEGEVVGRGATIRSAPLRSDGLALAGSPSVLLTVDQSWEGRTVEGPSLAQTAAGLVLLYSANRWDSAAYAVGAARCDSPSGPCRKVAGPILATFGPMVGPGGAELFTDAAGATRVVFHAWQGHEVGYPEHRYLHLGTLTADGGGVSIRID
ncbi:MAG TPA: glycoside hydrolase family 43 protein, partial [Acidimicrobiales bacterium]|nr:glycoside hydrolase family 43 protein [Acidimicrobiales bacterium]